MIVYTPPPTDDIACAIETDEKDDDWGYCEVCGCQGMPFIDSIRPRMPLDDCPEPSCQRCGHWEWWAVHFYDLEEGA